MSRSTQTQSQRREPIRDPKYKMPFGKYKGFSIEEIMQGDPRYLLWLHNNTDFELHADIFDEADKEVQMDDWNPVLYQEKYLID